MWHAGKAWGPQNPQGSEATKCVYPLRSCQAGQVQPCGACGGDSAGGDKAPGWSPQHVGAVKEVQ